MRCSCNLRAKGGTWPGDTQDMDGVGRFGWVTDSEGNRVELWQPAYLVLAQAVTCCGPLVSAS